MSDYENTNTAVSHDLLICNDPMALPVPIRRGNDRIYDELCDLSQLMPTRYGALFRYRWGLDTHVPHMTCRVATKFDMSKATVEGMLTQSLWNVTRWAHHRDLPAIGALLGDDPTLFAARAWQQAEQRWGHQHAAFSEAVLLLAVGGLPVPDAHAAARQRMVELGLARSNRWGAPPSDQERVEDAEQALDRILEQVIWPSDPAHRHELTGFSSHRPLPQWAPARSGLFRSDKLGRLAQFDSTLELRLLRQLEFDPRVARYQEQPVELPFDLDGETRTYTPDIAVQLVDGGVFLIEAKPLRRLGEFTNLLKWEAMANWCEDHGLGFWIGSPERSLVEHQLLQPDPEKLELIMSELESGPITGDDYYALAGLVGYEELGLAATHKFLDWRPNYRSLTHIAAGYREEAERFWQLVVTPATASL